MTPKKENPMQFPLVDSSYDNQEIIACIETLLSGQLTMGEKVRAFEKTFAEKVGAPFAVMCNSGSSANLLAFAAVTNPIRARQLKRGDKVAIPAVCWSTSIWPVIQMGLVPVLVDVDPNTMNMSIPSLKRAVLQCDIKAILLVHVLGNSTEINEVLEIAHNNDLLLIEDACESLGSTHKNRWLGTVGEFGTYSMYFSHHITTIEGGMVVTKTEADYDLLKCLRSHGWSRELSNRDQIEAMNPTIDPRFLFVNIGYNLRPMEIQAAFGLEQIKRLDSMNFERRSNVSRLRNAMRNHPMWQGQFMFPEPTSDLDPCWFGFPIIFSTACVDYRSIVNNLVQHGIDTRPIVSGNFAIQPALQLFDIDMSLGPFDGAQRIHDRGIFIGCHSKRLEDDRIESLSDIVLRAAIGAL